MAKARTHSKGRHIEVKYTSLYGKAATAAKNPYTRTTQLNREQIQFKKLILHLPAIS